MISPPPITTTYYYYYHYRYQILSILITILVILSLFYETENVSKYEHHQQQQQQIFMVSTNAEIENAIVAMVETLKPTPSVAAVIITENDHLPPPNLSHIYLPPLPIINKQILDSITTPILEVDLPPNSTKPPTYRYQFGKPYFSGQLYQSTIQNAISKLPTSTYTLQNFGGWPLCIMTNFCLRQMDRMWYRRYYFSNPNNNKNPQVISLDTESIKTTAEGRNCHPTTWHTRNMIQYNFNSILIDKPKLDTNVNVTWVRGTTFIINTAVASRHLGHVGSKVIQFLSVWNFAHLRHGWTMDDFSSQIFLYNQSPFPSSQSPYLSDIIRLGFGPYFYYKNRTLFQNDFHKSPGNLICMERVLEISSVSERKFVGNVNGLRDFQNYVVASKWPQSIGSKFQSLECPPYRDNIYVLHRVDGQGLRRIINFSDFEQSLYKILGKETRYENVSIASHSSSATQVDLFANFSLLISPHSTQLFNLIFSHPLSAVLEYRPCCEPERKEVDPLGYKLWGRLPSSFCPGYDCGILFNVTFHNSGIEHESSRDDVRLNCSIFESDLRHLLFRQLQEYKKTNCILPNYLTRFEKKNKS
jgi:hypothetical protein